MKKIFAVLSVLVFSVTIYISAQGPVGGGGGTAYITPSSGGSANVYTMSNNNFTASQLFSATNTFLNTNVFYGPLMVGTNAYTNYGLAVKQNPATGVKPLFVLDDSGSTSLGAEFDWGNLSQAGAANVREQAYYQIDHSTHTILMNYLGGGLVEVRNNIATSGSMMSWYFNNTTLAASFDVNGFSFPMFVCYTNTASTHVGTGTNNFNAYKVQGVLGFTGSITNLGPGLGSSNVIVYSTGLVTNKFTIP